MHHWIDTSSALAGLAQTLADAPRIGLDTEFMRVRTYWPELALLQACVDGTVWLVDPLACGPLAPLAPVFARSALPKVMHSASEDVVALAPATGEGFDGLFDTQVAAAFAGLGPGIGYQRLVADLLGVALEKGETRSDWMARPLSARQLHYAEADVLHLDALHDLLGERLERRAMLAWCAEDCARLARGALPPAQPHWDFKTLWKWPHERQARLRRLLDWREQAARRIDRPRLWLFDNPTAVALVEDPPADARALGARLATQKGFPKREIDPLWHALSAPVEEADFAGFQPIPEPLRGEAEQCFEALRERVAARAAALDLPPALLAPRRVLETLARGLPSPESAGWRSTVLAEELAALGLPAPLAPAP
jgi:ribonuclease D